MTTMRAAILRGKEDVAIEDVAVPHPGPGEVVIQVETALTCGTDAKVFRRGFHAKMLQPPCLFGHEYAGTVAETGAGVTRFREGDRVVGANSAPCGRCDFCERRREALCDDLLFVNGAFAERLLVPARVVETNLHLLPDGVDPVCGAALEPVACVLKGIDVAAPDQWDSVLILGSGSIALFFASELRARGVATTVFCRSEAAAATARRMGATHAVVARSVAEGRDALLATTSAGSGFDVVVEAAGAEETTFAAPFLARKGGRVLLFGGCAGDVLVPVNPARLHYEEIHILTSFHHTPRHVRGALDAIASRRIDPRPVLEDPVQLIDLPETLRKMSSRALRGKVPVRP